MGWTSKQTFVATAIFTFFLIVIWLAPSATIWGDNVSQSRFDFKGRVELPSKTFKEVSRRWSELDHLIIVPGHAIQWCTERGKSLDDESCWYLLDYQRGQMPIFIEHIRVATKMAHEDSRVLLMFSGGQTRAGLGPRSEGQSYFAVAERMGLLSGSLFDRAVTEEFARDSLENLIFSTCRFRQITGKQPRKVTVVGFPFKSRRFRELHRKAAQLAPDNFEYVSVEGNAPGYDQRDISDDAFDDFKVDLFGCGPKLSGKRLSRNPYHAQHGYLEACPEMRSILSACKQTSL